jgi:hypothetical protein
MAEGAAAAGRGRWGRTPGPDAAAAAAAGTGAAAGGGGDEMGSGDTDVAGTHVTLSQSGACGAFVHGLEDEYETVRLATVGTQRERVCV